MKRYYRVIGVFALVLCIVAVLNIGKIKVFDQANATSGVLDLRAVDLTENTIIPLNGQWEYYPNQLLSLTDIELIQDKKYINVPSNMNKLGKDFSNRYGFATLRLKVKLKDKNTILGLKTSVIRLAHTIYINNKALSKSGTVGNNINSYIPNNTPYSTYFYCEEDEINIVVQLANYEYAIGGGLSKPIYMGSQQAITNLTNKLLAFDYIRIASFFMLTIFFMGLYFLNRYNLKVDNQRALLYFSFYCLAYALYVATQGQKVFLMLFPEMNYYSFSVLQRAVVPFAVVSQVSYLSEVFSQDSNKKVVKIFTTMAMLLVILVIILPVRVHTYFADYYAAGLSMSALVCSAIILLRAILAKREGSLLLLVSGIGIMIYAINETVYLFSSNFRYIRSPYEPLIFIAAQAFFQAQDFLRYHKNLISMENAFLAAQIKPHFLYNALNTVVALSYSNLERSRELIGSIANFLRGRFNYQMSHSLIPLADEIEMVKSYLKIEQARYEKRLKIVYDIESTEGLKIPPLVIQTLVENSIKHGIKSNNSVLLIKIIVKDFTSYYQVTVEDNGVGMSESKIKLLTSNYKNIRGLGIKNVNRRLYLLKNDPIFIESKINSGTRIIIKINKD